LCQNAAPNLAESEALSAVDLIRPSLDIGEMRRRLAVFCREKYDDPTAEIVHIEVMPGHAGFAWGFTVEAAETRDSWFIRLPPPNVRRRGTADVLRQVAALNALEGSEVPHCSVKWSGDEQKWFGSPYFVTELLHGDVLRLGKGEWAGRLKEEALLQLGREAMQALVGIHRIDTNRVGYLGAPVPLDEDVTRWDTFLERAADPHRLADAASVRGLLLEKCPEHARIGLCHGDFQSANLFCSQNQPRLLAVIDWELTGIGAVLNDLGWVCTFSDRQAWAPGHSRGNFLDATRLEALYVDAWGSGVPDIAWYRALACYKFAIITGFNLSLHRRGKRIDAAWEETKRSMKPLIQRASELLESL